MNTLPDHLKEKYQAIMSWKPTRSSSKVPTDSRDAQSGGQGPILKRIGSNLKGVILLRLKRLDPLKKLQPRWKNRRLPAIIALAILLLFGPAAYFLARSPKGAEAAWWNDQWLYRKSITITNSSGSNLSEFQVKGLDDYDTSALVTAGKMQSDCDDIRFTDLHGKPLPYWIESGCNTSTTDVWVKIPTINGGSGNTTTTIYLYYGNPSASSYQSGNDTFEFFDDFDDGVNGWTYSENGSAWSGAITTDQYVSSPNSYSITYPWGTGSSIGYYGRVAKSFTFDGQAKQFEVNARDDYIGATAGYHFLQLNVDSTTIDEEDVAGDEGGWHTLSGNNTPSSGSHEIILQVYDKQAVGNFGITGYFDNIRVRKYASPEPSAGSPGSEEESEGPVAYWKFDEGYGSTVYDETLNNNDGSLGTGSSAPSWQSEDMCLSGKCLRFDGSNDYIDGFTESNFDFTGDFTISTWINIKNLTQAGIITKYASDASRSYALYIGSDNSTLGFSTYNSDSPSGYVSYSPQANTWHHVLVKKDSGTLYMFINGNQVSSDATATMTANDNELKMGVWHRSSDYYFNGFIDEVKIYPYARSAAQIKADYLAGAGVHGAGAVMGRSTNSSEALSEGLVGYWKMDEASWNGTADEVVDSSGNGNHGVGVGTTPPTTTAGVFGNGGAFDGNDKYAQVSDSASLDLSTNFTLQTWVNGQSGDHNYYWGIKTMVQSPGGTTYIIAREETDITLGGTPHTVGSGSSPGVYSEALGGTSADPTTVELAGEQPVLVFVASSGDDMEYFPPANSTNTLFYGICTASLTVANIGSTAADVTATDIAWSGDGDTDDGYSQSVDPGDLYSSGCDGADFIKIESSQPLVVLAGSREGTAGETTFMMPAIDNPWGGKRGKSFKGPIAPLNYHGEAMVVSLEDDNSITASCSLNNGSLTQYENGTSLDKGARLDVEHDCDYVEISATKDIYVFAGDEYSQDFHTGWTYIPAADTNGFAGQDFALGDFQGIFDSGNPTAGIFALHADTDLTITKCDTEESIATPTLTNRGDNYNQDISGTNLGGICVTADKPIQIIKGPGYANQLETYNPTESSPHLIDKLNYGVGLVDDTIRGLSGGYVASASSALSSGWNHVAVTYDKSLVSGNIKIYLNGEESGETDFSDSLNSNSSELFLGNNINGTLDEVRIYNRALSARETRDLYLWAPGPYAYLPFDDDTGTTIADKSGNNYSGTWNGSGTHWTEGKYGSGALFDGSTDYVSFSSLPKPDNLPITIEFWAKPSTSTPVGIFDSAPSTADVFRNYEAGKVEWWNNAPEVTLGLTANQWVHLAFVYSYSGGTQYIEWYKNGVKQTTGSTAGDGAYGWTTFRLGSINGGSAGWYSGVLDEFKIYNYARTQAQIREDMLGRSQGSLSAGGRSGMMNAPRDSYTPVAHWRFDEGYGTTAYDESPNSNNGTLGAGSSAPSWSNSGKFGKALSFDEGDYVDAGTNTSLNLTSTISIAAWVKIDSFSNQRSIVSKWTSTESTRQYTLIILDANTLRFLINESDDNQVDYQPTTNTTLNTTSWYHIVATADGSNLHVYLNGNEIGSGTSYDGTIDSNPSVGVLIGKLRSSDNTYPFDGKIDEPKIYNYALSEDEVKLEYNRSASMVMGALGTDSSGNVDFSSERSYCVPGDATSCSDPVAEWKLDEKGGTSVNDTSGTGNDGSLSGATWKSSDQCKKVACLYFDGNDEVTVSNGPTLSTNATIQGWFHWDSGAASLIRDNTSSNGWILAWDSSGNLIYRLGGSQFNSGVSVSSVQNKWVHYAMTKNGGDVKYYINGKLEHSSSGAGSTSSALPWHIMKNGASSGYITGYADHIKIYDYARSPAQIAWDYNHGAPVGHWRLDEGEGGTAYDEGDWGASGNDGSINIGGSGTQTTVAVAWSNGETGKINRSLNFDGTDDYIEANDAGELTDPGPEITLSAWIKPSINLPSGYTCPLGNLNAGTTTGWHWCISPASSNTYLYLPGGIAVQSTNEVSYSSGTWYHIAVTYKEGTTTGAFYLNGAAQPTTVTSKNFASSSQNLQIGRTSYNNGFWLPGQIDDVRIYNYALTEAQIKQVYNAGAAVRYGPATGSP